ncbi:GH43 family beta-xylosidase [Paenibacillus cellulosilyticus]|uniref:GH43 family beta-xylosidase n=1 Tax=Paenibacillus cellulosilyticus TaxID=375489 RepID=A0A2V2Z237_9BACL|nr:family 43 glycosylhydrolase [Paenibacillus cellulosilyticus]PWW07195.1 GH43 family beta-xylosidase [Paenibacillus cellulosilyticus]QKS44603.1 family 43 glycosylhydrolase [Paenibacillus cellulosilyticus]
MITEMKNDRNDVLCYTREPQEDIIYANKLAYSMHLAYSGDGERYEALNHNSGVLFAKATDNEDGTMNPKSLKNPYLFQLADGTFAVVAVRTEHDGQPDEQSKGSVLLFTSSDLLQYNEIGLIDLKGDTYVQDIACSYDAAADTYVMHWTDENGSSYRNVMVDLLHLSGASAPEQAEALALPSVSADIEGIVPRNVISVSPEIAHRLVRRLTVPTNVAVQVPEQVTAASVEELNAVRATAVYSDGTTAGKSVAWQAAGVNWSAPGTYRVSGTVHQDRYAFPTMEHRADPNIAKWNGRYYFIATNDADHNKTLYIRESDTISGLVDAAESLILDTETYDHIKGLLWAPELHSIEGNLYIFHAATTGEFFYEECHVMKLREGGNPTVAADWSEPMRVVKKDGSYLCEAGKVISLDMTVIQLNGECYAAWSERQFLPVDIGAWIYIAKIDPKEPWRLISDPVLLSKPDYGWANNHTFVDEGPFVIIRDKKLFMTISSALVDATYCVGLLTIDTNADLLNPASWTKTNYPLLTSRSVEGEYGPGHNSYVTDEHGVIWNVYHGRPGVSAPRCSGLRRVHFDIDGYPVLDLTEDKDLNPALTAVSIEVVVK